jgi:hypothetical protein
MYESAFVQSIVIERLASPCQGRGLTPSDQHKSDNTNDIPGQCPCGITSINTFFGEGKIMYFKNEERGILIYGRVVFPCLIFSIGDYAHSLLANTLNIPYWSVRNFSSSPLNHVTLDQLSRNHLSVIILGYWLPSIAYMLKRSGNVLT